MYLSLVYYSYRMIGDTCYKNNGGLVSHNVLPTHFFVTLDYDDHPVYMGVLTNYTVRLYTYCIYIVVRDGRKYKRRARRIPLVK